MDCIKEARNLIKEGRMRDNMVSVESGEKGLDLGIEKETAGREKLKEVSTERQKIEKILLELKQFKKQRISAKLFNTNEKLYQKVSHSYILRDNIISNI